MSETGASAADNARHAAVESEPDQGVESRLDDQPDDQPEPSWWHRSHPTFAGLMGFFTGIGFVILVPGIYGTLLNALVRENTAEKLFPLVLIALIVPLALLVPRKTRRFAQMMLLGMVATVLVVGATTALVLWLLVSLDK
jgi:hypothetical protein